MVVIPSIDCILGDKLTAFAPHTTGIPFDVNKEMEIIKQMFDISTLIEEYGSFKDVCETYRRVALAEISYRGDAYGVENVLADTIETAACIASRGILGLSEYQKLMDGIKSIRTHIYKENYSGEIAAIQACSVIYMAACILKNSPFVKKHNLEDYVKVSIGKSKYKSLAYMKKLNLQAYAYIVEAVRLLGE